MNTKKYGAGEEERKDGEIREKDISERIRGGEIREREIREKEER